MKQTYNFSAGPSMMPKQVMVQIQDELLNYQHTKTSAIEVSHRSADFMDLAQNTRADLCELMNIPDDYKVLFLQGGASAQFSMVPINLLNGKNTANYANTGHWSIKAINEAKRYCNVNICTDSSTNNYTNIEDFSSWKIDHNAAYLHYTPNETIAGLEFNFIPKVDMPIVADMSSTILSRPIDVSKFGVIYASSQKNIAPAGLTIVIIRKDLIGNAQAGQPILFNYATQANNQSMYNTPSTFAWYAASLVFKWLKQQGGINTMAILNQQKANKLYKAIDTSNLYLNSVNPKYRSWMNVVFTLTNDNLNQLFLEKSYNANLLALKGHKSVGGMRASIYNAMPLEGVNTLIEFMTNFEKQYG